MFEITIAHDGLKAIRKVRGNTQGEAELQARFQLAQWDARWKLEGREKKAARVYHRWEAQQQAEDRTREVQELIQAIEQTLKRACIRGKIFDLDDLKVRTPFALPKPEAVKPVEPPLSPIETAPVLSLWDKLIPNLRRKKESKAHAAFADALKHWQSECEMVSNQNQSARETYILAVKEWEAARAKHKEQQTAQHQEVDTMIALYKAGDPSTVEFVCSEVLSRSEYPETFPRESSVNFTRDNGTLLVDLELPNPSVLPKIKEVKYVTSKDSFKETPVPETWLRRAYDDLLYQMALRSLHEIFLADDAAIIISIVLNGWVRSIDKASGQEVHGCILSVQVSRDEFFAINLAQVDPKACFKKFQGVASSKLVELIPVRPILNVSREDRRFVTPYAVADFIDDRTNLAAMDWQDFENLIREIFEKEFNKNGGEVKITQASRDGGVDAIAFDPDPIRGGKIVIQAKRYTNVVGVAAVRDLFGTVHNEGATKGILVTTATYGHDAYEFARGKPLTLLSGSELLYLLERHGHRARIDLTDAKIQAVQNK